MCAEHFDALNFPYYEYRQKREGSITDTSSWKSVVGLEKFIIESANQLTMAGKPKNKKSKYALSFVAYEYVILLLMLVKYKSNQKEKNDAFFEKIQMDIALWKIFQIKSD